MRRLLLLSCFDGKDHLWIWLVLVQFFQVEENAAVIHGLYEPFAEIDQRPSPAFRITLALMSFPSLSSVLDRNFEWLIEIELVLVA